MPIVLAKPEVGLTTGAGNKIILGTGMAMPPGIESIFEYNGVYLNVRKWIDKIRITDIGGFDDAEVRDTRENNPSDHGETPFNAYYAGRPLVLTGRIEAYTLEKLRDMQMGLRLAFASLKELPLIIRTGNIDRDAMINCRKVSPIQMKETQQDAYRFFREFQISLRASNPRFVSYRQHIEGDDFVGAGPVELDCFNVGNFNAQPIYVIRGGITDPVIHNHMTDETLSIDGTIPDGDTWTINIAKKTMKDQDGVSVFQYLTDDSHWPEMIPRNNTIHMHGSSPTGTPRLDVYWRDTWM